MRDGYFGRDEFCNGLGPRTSVQLKKSMIPKHVRFSCWKGCVYSHWFESFVILFHGLHQKDLNRRQFPPKLQIIFLHLDPSDYSMTCAFTGIFDIAILLYCLKVTAFSTHSTHMC